ncbi:MAG: AsnC family transcriptional regulator [Candidatus Thorarchaeota archaeon]
MSLDAIDVEIIRLLIKDCRISFQELSKIKLASQEAL